MGDGALFVGVVLAHLHEERLLHVDRELLFYGLQRQLEGVAHLPKRSAIWRERFAHDTTRHDTRQARAYLGGPGVQQLGSASDGGRERRRADGALPRTLRRLGCAYRRRLRAARRCGELGVATGLGSECLL